jgi:hypothetical protein
MTYVKLGLDEAYIQRCSTTATAVLEICGTQKIEDKEGFRVYKPQVVWRGENKKRNGIKSRS